MKKKLIIILATAALSGYEGHSQNKSSCSGNCTGVLACSLAAPELHARKDTVIKELKGKLVHKEALANGYRYTFPGNDAMVDQLAEFIKTERACCGFFTFGLTVKGDSSEALLDITGCHDGIKDFIDIELGL